jgi:predicted branched-subunit amino acid permease
MPPDKGSTTSEPLGTSSGQTESRSADAHRAIVRDALGIGIASGAYALSFGALATVAGLSLLQTIALSTLMFTGASQFALVGVLGAGGSVWAGAATAALLGTRNALYGVRLSSLLGGRGLKSALAAHFVLDESTAMAIARDSEADSRYAFWATGIAVFTLWNLGTLIGAIATHALSNPKVLGLDAAPPAAFLALLAPRLRAREPMAIALLAAVVAIVFLPFVPAGIPLLIVAAMVVVIGLFLPASRGGRRVRAADPAGGESD